MKKLISFILAATMLLGLCSYAKAEDITLPAENPPSESAFAVAVFYPDLSDGAWDSLIQLMDAQFGAEPGKYALTHHDGASVQAKQTQDIESALDNGAKLLMISLVNLTLEEVAQSITDLAAQRDVPIIFFGGEVTDAVVQSYAKCVYINADENEAGLVEALLLMAGNVQAELELMAGTQAWTVDEGVAKIRITAAENSAP